MYNYLTKFNIFTEYQHGFRKGKSTQTAACSLIEFIYTALDNGKQVAGLFFDLSRAFDSINLNFINSKLYNIGFRGTFLDWIDDYLRDREMLVRVEHCFSEKKMSNIGVPQGSVLGPLIFLLFINDMPQHINAKLLAIFADDTSLAVTACTYEELIESTKQIMICFNSWCAQNGLMANIPKTDCIYFTPHTNTKVLQFYLNGATVKSTECTKFLGIYVDQSLRWTNHIDILSKKLNKARFAIMRLRSSLPVESLLTVYYSLVYSHMSYNVILWGNSVNNHRIFVTQKRIIRTMFNLPPNESCKHHFVAYGILTFPSLFVLKCLLYVKDNIRKLKTNSHYHDYPTRNRNLLSIPSHRTAKFEGCPTYQGMMFYNHLPESIQQLDVNSFKNKVKSLLTSKCYYSIRDFMTDRELG